MNSQIERKAEAGLTRKFRLYTLTGTVFFILLTGAMPSYAQAVDEVAVLKTQVDLLRRQYLEIREVNARLEDRVMVLEDKVKTLPQAPAPRISGAATPEVAKVAKSTEISLLESYSKRQALDSRSILDKLPDYIPNYYTKGLEFHGYFRSGYGVNSKGGKMEAFMAPDALAKFRLGNEQETYIELILANKNWNPDPEGITITTQSRIAYQSQQNQTWDTENLIVLREMYAQMGRFLSWDQDAKVWGGQRFCRLPELDIIDFWWYDLSGYGGGFEDINIMDVAKLDVTYIGFSSNDLNLSTQRGRIAKNNLNFMFKNIDVPGGKGSFWINGGYMKEGIWQEDTNRKFPDMGGVDVGFMHYVPGELNNNQFAVQYGTGANISLSAGAEIPQSSDARKAWRVRVTEMLNRQINDNLCVQVDGVYQYTDYGDTTKYRETWISFGMRPIYSLTKHFALELEPGVDYVNNPRDGLDSCLYKLTGAIRISPGNIFNSRPEFRIFATYATWGNDFMGRVGGGDAFLEKTEGMNFGVQCENWW